MKTIIYFLFACLFAGLVSCSSSKMGGYHQSKKEVDALKAHDYHANTANKIIDTNQKNKKKSARLARTEQEKYQAYLNTVNQSPKATTKKKSTKNKNPLSNSTAFSFY